MPDERTAKMQHISAVVETIVGRCAENSATAQNAHEQAAAFHEALATAIQAKEKIAETQGDEGWKDIQAMWRTRYANAIDEATAAAQHMPALWLINLAPELAKVIGEN